MNPIMDDFSSKYTDNPILKFQDLSDEDTRQYTFPNGSVVTIKEPVALATKKDKEPPVVGSPWSHRIVDSTGIAHYVPSGWILLSWKPKAGRKPVAF